jgi:hypothetical protein
MPQPTTSTFLFLLLSLLYLHGLTGQDSTSVRADPWRTAVDQSTQMMIDNQDFGQRLIFGGGFYASNPEIDYEVDEKKLYLDTKLRPASITLVGGLTDTLPARIQLFDQVVEVIKDDKEFQVDAKSLQSIITEDGRRFLAYRQPLVVGQPAPLMEILAESDRKRLCLYRRVEWREPNYQKTSYDTDNYKKRLKRIEQVYLIAPYVARPIGKLKELITLLPKEQQLGARQYAKQERLRNRPEDFVKLMIHLGWAG